MEELACRLGELRGYLYSARQPLPLTWQPGRLDRADPGDWRPCPPGTRWGGMDSWAAFRVLASVPREWDGRPVVAVIGLTGTATDGGEGLVYLDGRPYQGIDRNHRMIRLTEAAEHGREWLLTVDAYTLTTGPDQFFTTAGAFLAIPDPAATALFHECHAVLESAAVLPENSPERARLLQALDEAILHIDWRNPMGEGFRASLAAAGNALAERRREIPRGERPFLAAAGHAHIDVAWLWPLAQTRQKAARTFSTVLRLMECYEEFHFTQSQPQLYQFITEDYPRIAEEIRQRVAEGRWEPTGGMWVEADCNLAGGESLVRQFLFGTRFFAREYGSSGTPILWLPDCFGFPWTLPEIAVGSGFPFFMTTKLSWNDTNRFPYDSFRWRGPDGTEILAHFVNTPDDWGPEEGIAISTYNGLLNPEQVNGSWDRYRHRDIHQETLLLFGHGDGGGGPTSEMIECGRLLADMPGMPQVLPGRAADFFGRLAEKAAALPVWDGELYLEYHRGTYTTQARNKRANRQSEIVYHHAELFASLAHLWGEAYPRAILNRGWELILTNQFHDILPGSSIRQVYEESQDQYARLQGWGGQVLDAALEKIAAQVAMSGPGLIVFNPTGWERHDTVEVGIPSEFGRFRLCSPDGAELPQQIVGDDASGARIIFSTRGVPPLGYHVYLLQPDADPGNTGGSEGASAIGLAAEPAGRYELENCFFRVTFNDAGQLVSWWDKEAGREIVPRGTVANQFQYFEDRPLAFDAWNIDRSYQDEMWTADGPAEIVLRECGPVRAILETRRTLGHSSITQRIAAYAGLPRLDFHTEIDWQEKHVLLKVAFPVEIRATNATYDIQFGNVERPTHANTSWDRARFEVCAHKWVDLSEGDYGVSLLNDGKYGHDIRDNVIRLTLLRSPTAPDPHADEGRHVFTYSLYPHRGDWRTGTIEQAYALNMPLIARYAPANPGSRPACFSLLRADTEHVIVETVKKAEDATETEAEFIVRVYEAHGRRGPTTLVFGAPIEAASECNLVEREDLAGGVRREQVLVPH